MRGVTFIEALIVLAIMSVLAAVTLPSMRHYLGQSHAEVVKAQILESIQIANQQAKTRHLPVALCRSHDRLTCSRDHGEDVLIFVDESDDGVVLDQSKLLLVRQLNLQQGDLFLRSYPAYRQYLLFVPQGLTRSDNGTIWYCQDATLIWAVMLNKTGRARVALPDQHGVINDGNGTPLSCLKTSNHVRW